MKIFEGKLIAAGRKFGVVVGRFNNFIGKELLAAATDCLQRHGVADEDIEVAWVPGSFEIPLVAHALAQSGKYDGIICLGVLIRGHTPHFDFIAAETTNGIFQVGISTGIPASYGIITADTIEQAIERAGTKSGNKGWEAAMAAMEMVDLLKQLS